MIDLIIKFLSGGAGQAVGSGFSNTMALAALAPAGLWFVHHKDEALITLSYGEAAVFGLVLFFVLKVIHYTSPVKA